MTYHLLSYPLENNAPVHKGLAYPKIVPESQISQGKYYNSYIINVENHSGTHVDAPGHLLDGGKKIGEYSPDELVFNNPLILDCPKSDNEFITIQDLENIELNDVDCLFFKTGFGKYRDSDVERYLTQNPGLSPELVEWIRKNYPEIRCLGLDTISISCFQKVEQGIEAHLNAFNDDYGVPLLLVEDINFSISNEIKKIIIIPWQIKEVDSTPCTILAQI